MNSIPYLAAEALTAAAINIAGKDAAGKLAAAQTASTVAAFFAAAGKGDISAANAQVSTAIASLKDPGLQKLATDLWSAGEPFVQTELTVYENTPVLGGSLEQALSDTGAGMAAVAGAYLTSLTPSEQPQVRA